MLMHNHVTIQVCNASAGQGSIGIHLVGEDNYVENTIVFDFTCVGVLVDGAASLLEGVHSWNGGGVAILINGSYDIQVFYLKISSLHPTHTNSTTITMATL
jgi:hypothetical protein